jgi:uncharacterized membrane protein
LAMISADFGIAAEKTTIWFFLTCYILCVGLMAPEVFMGGTAFNIKLSIFAGIALLFVSICWAIVIVLLFLARHFLSQSSDHTSVYGTMREN